MTLNRICYLSSTKVEAPTTNHLRDYAPILERYKAMQTNFPYKKIELRELQTF